MDENKMEAPCEEETKAENTESAPQGEEETVCEEKPCKGEKKKLKKEDIYVREDLGF